MSNFPHALALLRREECAPRCQAGEHAACYTVTPDDPGGATCCGIIQATYDAYRRRKGLPAQSVRLHTWEEHAELYRSRFWDRPRCDLASWPLAAAYFDACVNHGTEPFDAKGRKKVSGIVLLQRALGIADDGLIGPVTIRAIEAAPAVTFHRLLLERVFRYDELVDQSPRLGKFLTGGWLGRLEHLYRGAAGSA